MNEHVDFFKTISPEHWLIVRYFIDHVEVFTFNKNTGETTNKCTVSPGEIELCPTGTITDYRQQRALGLTRHYANMGYDVLKSVPKLVGLGFGRCIGGLNG